MLALAVACSPAVSSPPPSTLPAPATLPLAPTPSSTPTPPPTFDGQRAFQDLAFQVALGPRPVGSPAHAQLLDWLIETLEEVGWQAEIQRTTFEGHEINNVIARRGNGKPWIILGAHFDTRLFADSDPDPAKREEAVLGANDGASGVAVLTELARVLPPDLDKEIWLVFFDAEDNGRIPGWDWILGSRAFVASLERQPDAAVIVDMVGDADLQIYRELNSTPELVDEIWSVAAGLGYSEVFINQPRHSMLDDHTPFLEARIPAIDIIDFDYPYWHTVEDTLDKVSARSLQVVGDTVLAWLLMP